MKKIWLIGLAVLVFGLQSSGIAGDGSFNPGSEPDGFRGIKWGTDISTLEDMGYGVKSPGRIKQYIRKNENLHLGGVELNLIVYEFWRGRFFDVAIYTKGYTNWTNLRKTVFEKFGRNYQDVSAKTYNCYKWSGSITGMFLEYSDFVKQGKLCMFSKEIEKQKKTYEEQKDRE